MFCAEAQKVIQPDNVREDRPHRVSGIICRVSVASEVNNVICLSFKALKDDSDEDGPLTNKKNLDEEQ